MKNLLFKTCSALLLGMLLTGCGQKTEPAAMTPAQQQTGAAAAAQAASAAAARDAVTRAQQPQPQPQPTQ